MNIYLRLLSVLMFLYPLSFQAHAEEGDMSIGLYGNIVGSGGKPSNDVLGVGLIGNYQLKNSWFVDLEYIRSEADFERPWKIVGLQQDESIVKTVDAVYTSSSFMAQIGKNVKSNNPSLDWYWSVGLGFNSINVDDATGPLVGGGSFNIKTEADTETLIGLKGGIKQQLSANWRMNYALRVNYHLADWTVTDAVSSASAKIDNYTLYGISIGVERKF